MNDQKDKRYRIVGLTRTHIGTRIFDNKSEPLDLCWEKGKLFPAEMTANKSQHALYRVESFVPTALDEAQWSIHKDLPDSQQFRLAPAAYDVVNSCEDGLQEHQLVGGPELLCRKCGESWRGEPGVAKNTSRMAMLLDKVGDAVMLDSDRNYLENFIRESFSEDEEPSSSSVVGVSTDEQWETETRIQEAWQREFKTEAALDPELDALADQMRKLQDEVHSTLKSLIEEQRTMERKLAQLNMLLSQGKSMADGPNPYVLCLKCQRSYHEDEEHTCPDDDCLVETEAEEQNICLCLNVYCTLKHVPDHSGSA